MAEGREVIDFHQSNCKKPRVRPLKPAHYGQSPKVVAIQNDYFLKKATDSQRKLGSDGNGNPKLWSRGRRFFFIKKSIIDKILAVRLEGLFWVRNKVACSFGFGLWASHYGHPSREAVGVHGQRFGLWAWPFEVKRLVKYEINLKVRNMINASLATRWYFCDSPFERVYVILQFGLENIVLISK
jgi:hypothetical protein